MTICQSCSAYRKGRTICKNGFPIQYEKKPMCQKDDFSDIVFKCFFDYKGLPLLTKNYKRNIIDYGKTKKRI